MKKYSPFDLTPEFSPVTIKDFIAQNFNVDEQKNFNGFLWSCGKHHVLFEMSDEVLLRENRDNRFFVCPLNLPWKTWFPWVKVPCKEKLQGKKQEEWEKKYDIHESETY
jgi:hypothetical protein